MSFTQFHNMLKDFPGKEERSITVFGKNVTVPVGKYTFVESYCDDDDCDCRKVMINVIDASNCRCLATIGYGWESMHYYTEWMFGDKKIAQTLAGSYLEPGGQQSEYAQAFVKIWETIIMTDKAYVARLKKHYVMFKKMSKFEATSMGGIKTK